MSHQSVSSAKACVEAWPIIPKDENRDWDLEFPHCLAGSMSSMRHAELRKQQRKVITGADVEAVSFPIQDIQGFCGCFVTPDETEVMT